MRGGDRGFEDRAQERASVGHGFTEFERDMRGRLSIRFRQKKTPAACCGGLREAPEDRSSDAEASATDVGVDDVAEALPGLTLESLELNSGDRGEVGGAGIDLDARKQATELKSLDAGRLLHDVLAREIVAAGLQHMLERLRDGVGIHHKQIGPVAFREVLGEELV